MGKVAKWRWTVACLPLLLAIVGASVVYGTWIGYHKPKVIQKIACQNTPKGVETCLNKTFKAQGTPVTVSECEISHKKWLCVAAGFDPVNGPSCYDVWAKFINDVPMVVDVAQRSNCT